MCFVFRNMPVGVRSGIATLSQIDKSLDEASLTLGARSVRDHAPRRSCRCCGRPIVASLVYSFVRAMTAVSAVIFLVTAEYNMATTYIVGRVEAGEFGLAIAYSSVLIVVMLVAILLIQLAVGERRLGRRTAAPAGHRRRPGRGLKEQRDGAAGHDPYSRRARRAGRDQPPAQAPVTVYCSILEEQCRLGVAAFERATGIKVAMVRKSTGETYAQIKAEASNPRADVWWGGPGDPHLQAAEEGLLEEYKSPMLAELHDWARAPRRAGAVAHRRHLSRRARHRLQHQGAGRSAACPSRNAGPTCSIRASRTRCRSRTRTPPAPPMCCSPRSSSSWARTRRSTT